MSADLILRLASQVGDPVGNLRLRHVNTVNTPVVGTPTWLGSGVAIADTYTCVLTKSGTVTCTVDCNVKNPYRDMTGKVVVCDGVTVNKEIVPGVGIILSASSDTGWTFKVTIGQYMDGSAVVTPVFGFGVVEAGTATTGVRIACLNVGDAPAQQTKIYSLPGLWYYGTGYLTFLQLLAPHTNPTRHKMADTGTYTITFQDWKDAGGGKKSADVYVNGTKCIEDAIFDGTTVYQYGSANGYIDGSDLLKGLQLTLANTTSDPSAASFTLKITADAYTWTQFAPDNSGSFGTFANQDLDLTQAGQPTGTINASGDAKFWAKKVLPDAATAGDMRKGVIRTRGLTT